MSSPLNGHTILIGGELPRNTSLKTTLRHVKEGILTVKLNHTSKRSIYDAYLKQYYMEGWRKK